MANNRGLSGTIGRRPSTLAAAALCALAASCVGIDSPNVQSDLAPELPDTLLWRAAPEPLVDTPSDLPAAPMPETPIHPRRRHMPTEPDRRFDRSSVAILAPSLPATTVRSDSVQAPLQQQEQPEQERSVAAQPPAAVSTPQTEPPPSEAADSQGPEQAAASAVERPAAARASEPRATAQTPAANAASASSAASAPVAPPVAALPPRSADWAAAEVFSVVAAAEQADQTTQAAESGGAATSGELVEIELPGTNWIYIGRETQIAFVSRNVVGDATAFAFRVAPGSRDVPLEFVATDAASGQTIEHRVLVSASDRPGLAEAAAFGQIEPDPAGQSAGEPERSLSSRLQAAIEQPTDAVTLTELARELIDLLAPDSELDTPVTADQTATDEPPPQQLVVPFARVLLGSDLPELAAVLLDDPLIFDPENDTIVFALAQAYERERLDLARSRELYQLLVDRHPFSSHWDAAAARIEYLDRTFFLIR